MLGATLRVPTKRTVAFANWNSGQNVICKIQTAIRMTHENDTNALIKPAADVEKKMSGFRELLVLDREVDFISINYPAVKLRHGNKIDGENMKPHGLNYLFEPLFLNPRGEVRFEVVIYESTTSKILSQFIIFFDEKNWQWTATYPPGFRLNNTICIINFRPYTFDIMIYPLCSIYPRMVK